MVVLLLVNEVIIRGHVFGEGPTTALRDHLLSLLNSSWVRWSMFVFLGGVQIGVFKAHGTIISSLIGAMFF